MPNSIGLTQNGSCGECKFPGKLVGGGSEWSDPARSQVIQEIVGNEVRRAGAIRLAFLWREAGNH